MPQTESGSFFRRIVIISKMYVAIDAQKVERTCTPLAKITLISMVS